MWLSLNNNINFIQNNINSNYRYYSLKNINSNYRYYSLKTKISNNQKINPLTDHQSNGKNVIYKLKIIFK